jgi:hypothetical protein
MVGASRRDVKGASAGACRSSGRRASGGTPVVKSRLCRRSWQWQEEDAMKPRFARVLALLLAACAAPALLAATPAQERQFVDAYRKAYEARDHDGLVALLYTNGADPQALTFYKMMLGAEMGGRISSIELLDLTAEDRARAESTVSLAGKPMKLVLPPTRKLVIRSGTMDKDGSSSSSSEVFIGESGGRLWILVPAAAK